MHTPLATFPADAFIAEAFAELIADTQALFLATMDQRPGKDADAAERQAWTDEIAFWRRQRNAFQNAQSDWYELGYRPTPTPNGYLFPSSSRPGALRHRVSLVGEIWCCSCEAGERGLFHRHTATVCVLERAAELETAAHKEAALVWSDGTPVPSEPPAWLSEYRQAA